LFQRRAIIYVYEGQRRVLVQMSGTDPRNHSGGGTPISRQGEPGGHDSAHSCLDMLILPGTSQLLAGSSIAIVASVVNFSTFRSERQQLGVLVYFRS
jgi:hypothetical protein